MKIVWLFLQLLLLLLLALISDLLNRLISLSKYKRQYLDLVDKADIFMYHREE